jgi:hypothetical protein
MVGEVVGACAGQVYEGRNFVLRGTEGSGEEGSKLARGAAAPRLDFSNGFEGAADAHG